MRGDDAVGPVLIRTLFTRGVPDGVRIVDGGTAGMDVAFGMRGASRVVIIDASATGVDPGTIYRVPAAELTQLPPIDGLHTHNFRWDHALSFSTWLLGPLRPTDVTVFLIEAERFDPGAELTDKVATAMHEVIRLLERDFYPPTVEINDSGYLHLSAELAAEHFASDACVARRDEDELILMPLISTANGGLVLKQRNASGERSVLISEVLGFEPMVGRFAVKWDDARGALHVLLTKGEPDGDRGADRGGPREWSVGGLPGDPQPGRSEQEQGADTFHEAEGATGSRRDPAYGGSSTPAQGGHR